jgi:hypothetical protein
VIAALTVSAVAAGVGCAAGPGAVLKGDPTVFIHAAPDRTLHAGTAKVSVSLGVAVGPGLAGDGVVDFRRSAAEMAFQRTGAGARTGDRYEVVVAGAQGYVSGTGLAGWLSGPLPDVAAATRARIAPLDRLLVRPGAGLALAFLRGAEKVLPYGGEEVEGTSTLRYSFVIDLAAAIAASPPDQRPALTAAATFIGNVLEPADVWLDGAGRVRRLQFATDPLLRSTTTKANFFTEDGEVLSFIMIDFAAFGQPASISLPPPAEVHVLSGPGS